MIKLSNEKKNFQKKLNRLCSSSGLVNLHERRNKRRLAESRSSGHEEDTSSSDHSTDESTNSSGEEGNHTSEETEALKLDPSFTRFTLIITITLTGLFLVIIAFIYGCNKDRLADIAQKLRKLSDFFYSKLRFWEQQQNEKFFCLRSLFINKITFVMNVD